MSTQDHFPVVIVHKGNSSYLEHCLRQIRKTNPETPIYLLGDETNNVFDFVIHRNLTDADLCVDIEPFRATYVHYSVFALRWERLCMERWLYIRNLLRTENLSGCLAVDSDLLLFCDIDEEARRFSHAAMTFAHWNPSCNLVHCNFIQNRAALDSFCDYMFQVYTDSTVLDRIKKYNTDRLHPYWISDMSLFGDWNRHSDFEVVYFEDYYSQAVCFDNCIDKLEHFRTQFYFPGIRPFKKVRFVDGRPYGQLNDGRSVPFKCLHYHGRFKFLLTDHYEGDHLHWKTFRTLLLQDLIRSPSKLKNAGKRMIRRLKHLFRRY